MEEKEKDSLSEAFQLLKEMRSVNREKGYRRFMSEISVQKKETRKRTIWYIVRNTAAILIPVLLLVNAYLLVRPSTANILVAGNVVAPSPMEVTAMNGTKVLFTLPDSTTVWLRGGSKLIYNANMTLASERKVEVHGEAYFNVTTDKEKPFLVSLNDIEVKVTGTAFNCNTDYHDRIQVTLAEGEVEMMKRSSKGNVLLTKLTPGEHFHYDTGKNTYSVKEVDVRKYTGWKDNYLLFDNDPMKDVLERISHWYGVDIQVADRSIESMRFTAQFDDLKLAQIIDILELSSNMRSTYIRGKLDENGKAIQDKLILQLK